MFIFYICTNKDSTRVLLQAIQLCSMLYTSQQKTIQKQENKNKMAIYIPTKNNNEVKKETVQDTINKAVELSSKTDSKSVKENARLQDYLWA